VEGRQGAVTRDSQLDLELDKGAPLLTVRGGKLTACRKLAEEAADLLRAPLGARGGANPLGDEAAPNLFEAELNDLRQYEWAATADDVLWRRTKLGLHLDAAGRAAVARRCDAHWSGAAPRQEDPTDASALRRKPV
jgi:glycerol-3-phosphate dehydrogenase